MSASPIFNVLIAGVGGQGVLLAARVLAEAAMRKGLDVKGSETHGMAQRGGSVVSHVRFGGRVYSPVIGEGECGLVIGFEPLETARHLSFLKPGAPVVYNTLRIPTLPVCAGVERYPEDIDEAIASRADAHPIDASRLAGQAGDLRALNLVLLGAAVKFLPIGASSVEAAIKAVVPPGSRRVNLRAFRLGLEALR